ncbi:DUF47 family protein [Lactonifactor sp. BIOML-A3]|uniref:DUF47 domain-containing protein n=1 Tax=unclassified Lactonifactor TaxID=2636670 RepID=UPI0012B03189|nr:MULTISPECIES: DUF47 family protein [unclassified Lactonifactor]MSA03630.1 DUF47 family protein [Lactonifactor sp. BIOML-A5]MSA10131.1 DUF47 family protein [Lactonifactor sp. BIOML-A4]MSA14637.1 DUF47 family protein [Lactonifactor sp. BIOML-A3]MSA19059.1 DUF47 family protein [Lactonifactor sp. BIOML-A2]MSA39777.1 DUF47 family protein [Lactonifactor sp. BIOML-A1]
MASRKENNYFNMFIENVTYACKAAALLQKCFDNFNPEHLPRQMEAMHQIEHTADLAKHTMMKHLHREFLPPIDREDIMELSETIDDVTDCIEDVMLRLYMFHITSLREDAASFADLILSCCEAMLDMMEEFSVFHKSKVIGSKIIEINRLEENGDRLYMEAMHRLYINPTSSIEAFTWTSLYDCLEKCCDRCERVADVVERVILKNS